MNDDNVNPAPKKYHLFAGVAWDYNVSVRRKEYYIGEFDSLEAAYKALPLSGRYCLAYLAELRDGEYVEVANLVQAAKHGGYGVIPCTISWRFGKIPMRLSPDDEYFLMEEYTAFIPPLPPWGTGKRPQGWNGDPLS